MYEFPCLNFNLSFAYCSVYFKSHTTISFTRAPIGQGYGLTETFAGAAFSEADDTSVGRVGPPLPCCYIKVHPILLMEKSGHVTLEPYGCDKEK